MVILLIDLHPFTHVMEFTFLKYHQANAKRASSCLDDMKQDSLNSNQHKLSIRTIYGEVRKSMSESGWESHSHSNAQRSVPKSSPLRMQVVIFPASTVVFFPPCHSSLVSKKEGRNIFSKLLFFYYFCLKTLMRSDDKEMHFLRSDQFSYFPPMNFQEVSL